MPTVGSRTKKWSRALAGDSGAEAPAPVPQPAWEPHVTALAGGLRSHSKGTRPHTKNTEAPRVPRFPAPSSGSPAGTTDLGGRSPAPGSHVD